MRERFMSGLGNIRNTEPIISELHIKNFSYLLKVLIQN